MDGGLDVEQIRAAIRLLYPEEMTPIAKRMLESICEEHEDAVIHDGASTAN